uniref:Uncharacterized protein n=1 Tax=Setaria viridis TaxID=4556 RepID=A0A4U6TED5_SETVI|nr:hypothetical protein SEVIR_8G116840v2 [Setaria viridis]
MGFADTDPYFSELQMIICSGGRRPHPHKSNKKRALRPRMRPPYPSHSTAQAVAARWHGPHRRSVAQVPAALLHGHRRWPAAGATAAYTTARADHASRHPHQGAALGPLPMPEPTAPAARAAPGSRTTRKGRHSRGRPCATGDSPWREGRERRMENGWMGVEVIRLDEDKDCVGPTT